MDVLMITTIISNIAIVIALVFSIMSYRTATKQNKLISDQLAIDKEVAKSTLEYSKKHDTIQFANEIALKTDEIFELFEKEYGINPISTEFLKNEENKRKLIQYLRLMERLAVGFNTKIYDLDVYVRMCCVKTINGWKKVESVVRYIRENETHSTSTYQEFERLSGTLEEWRRKEWDDRGKYNSNLLEVGGDK